jgi:hypothetical protein
MKLQSTESVPAGQAAVAHGPAVAAGRMEFGWNP